ncbi:MAG TPA: 2'-5' RNA ligase family protein [Roseiflexaceae bacterium]|nr:2'-5' RNA ligase family protein [Roseiflexaceae bacterium]
MDNDTSLIIPVSEAAFVQPFREQYLHRPGVTMPPHITLATPFKPVRELAVDGYRRLSEICAAVPAFAFRLERHARFEETGVLYLAPEPSEPFLALSSLLSAPEPPPTGQHASIVFHLTLARKQPPELDRLEAEFRRLYAAQLPIHGLARQVSLYEKRGERWFKQATFALAAP